MARVSSRVQRAWAKVCLGLATWSCLVAFSSSARAAAPEIFEESADDPGIVAYAPQETSSPRPVTIMLHGMCSEPERACRHFESTVTERGWLLCPRAKQRCSGGGSTWSSSGLERDIERGIERVRERYPEALDESAGRTLVGFSLGAFRALALAQSGAGKYPRVILIGAKIYPDARLLRQAGVERLLLAAGDFDMMSGHMRGRARSLARQGFFAAFQSYGPVGHAFPNDFPKLLVRGLDWTEGDDDALVATAR